MATVHAVVGAIGLRARGVRRCCAATSSCRKTLRFTNYKRFMRSAYALYMLATLSGVIVYVVAYVGS